MQNRIAQFWVDVDTLVASASAAAQQAEARVAACPFTAHHPLEVYLDRKYLKAVTGVSVRQMQRHLADQDPQSVVALQVQAEIARREAFIGWLDQESGDQVYMHLFPGAEYPVATPNMTPDDDTTRW